MDYIYDPTLLPISFKVFSWRHGEVLDSGWDL